MNKPPPKPTGPPGYHVATAMYGRAVLHNWPPAAMKELHQLARRYGIRQMNLVLTAQDINPEVTL